MIMAESNPRVIQTTAVLPYFCHQWANGRARRPLYIPSSRQACSIWRSFHSEAGMHTAFSSSLNRWKTLYQAAILETNKGLLPQRVSEAEEAVKARGREIFYGNETAEEKEAEALENALYTLRAFRTAWQHSETA